MAEPYFYLGLFHEHGLGNDRDFRSAYNYYKKAARLNHAEAISKCGDFLYSGRLSEGIQNRAEALKCYKKAAEMNCPSAINNLALMIESENKSDAMDLFKKAHKMGNVDATVNLAFAYHDSNPAVSKALLTYAAEKGHSRAPEYMYNLNLLESLQMNPLTIDSEDLQLLE